MNQGLLHKKVEAGKKASKLLELDLAIQRLDLYSLNMDIRFNHQRLEIINDAGSLKPIHVNIDRELFAILKQKFVEALVEIAEAQESELSN